MGTLWTSPTGRGSDGGSMGDARRRNDPPGSPTWMLHASAAAVAASLLLFAIGSGLEINIAGYALGSLVAFSFVAVFRRASITRLLATGVNTNTRANLAAAALLVVGLLCASVHAYLIARHYA